MGGVTAETISFPTFRVKIFVGIMIKSLKFGPFVDYNCKFEDF